MLNLGEVDALERRLKTSIVTLNKAKVSQLTLIEALDDAMLWSAPFEELVPIAPSQLLDNLISRAPLLICAVAAEIGFRFEGVGTVFWAKFGEAIGTTVTMANRQRIAEAFEAQATRFDLSRPTASAFSSHFSLMAWPIANAQLPVDLVGPVCRLMARAPVNALPYPGRSINLPILRAWASAAEGARLTDWLRFEGPTTRVLTALLTDNAGTRLSPSNYARLKDTVEADAEAFLSTRAARRRGLTAKQPTAVEQTFGRLSLLRASTGIQLFASWPALPPATYDEARGVARSAGWRPRLWGAGGFLHPDTALSAGPFAIARPVTPSEEDPAYPDAAAVFGAGSAVAAALASRTIDWTSTLLFEVGEDGSQAEQCLDALTGNDGRAWIGRRNGIPGIPGLKMIGASGGYQFFEADLADPNDRGILIHEELLNPKRRATLARHPVDAIGASAGIVRPNRPFIFHGDVEDTDGSSPPQRLPANGRLAASAGRSAVRAEVAPPMEFSVVDMTLFERDGAFEALVEGRLQIRVESRLPLLDVPLSADLEIDGQLIARGRDRVAALPATVPATSPLLASLYHDGVRAKLLESGRGLLRLSVGRSRAMEIPLQRSRSFVEWREDGPQLLDTNAAADLVEASAGSPHRFTPIGSIAPPIRGAKVFGLRFPDGRIADPMKIISSNVFDYGDFTAQFGDDVGSRRMFDRGMGVGEIARARIAWARARCTTLSAIGAKARIVRQFETPLVTALCGLPWSDAEQSTLASPTDPHAALWHVAIDRGLAVLPEYVTPDEAEVFARAFAHHARLMDPDWPVASQFPADGAMDDALNSAFSEAVDRLHDEGKLMDLEDDFDFGSPHEYWEAAAMQTLRAIERPALARRLAPSEGRRVLARRSYLDLSIAELAEDMAAWTKAHALPRGQLSPDGAAAALQLWLSPAACDDVDAAVHVLAVDPFVSRAIRYVALRAGPDIAGAGS